jgi:hypothetical protein
MPMTDKKFFPEEMTFAQAAAVRRSVSNINNDFEPMDHLSSPSITDL